MAILKSFRSTLIQPSCYLWPDFCLNLRVPAAFRSAELVAEAVVEEGALDVVPLVVVVAEVSVRHHFIRGTLAGFGPDIPYCNRNFHMGVLGWVNLVALETRTSGYRKF